MYIGNETGGLNPPMQSLHRIVDIAMQAVFIIISNSPRFLKKVSLLMQVAV